MKTTHGTPKTLQRADNAPCCSTQSHDVLKASVRRWTALRLEGYQYDPLAQRTYEMRDCPACHSSLMRLVDLSAARYPRDPHVAQKAA